MYCKYIYIILSSYKGPSDLGRGLRKTLGEVKGKGGRGKGRKEGILYDSRTKPKFQDERVFFVQFTEI